MKGTYIAIVLSLVLSAQVSQALKFSDLSPEAQSFVGDPQVVVVTMKDGKSYEGWKEQESTTVLMLRKRWRDKERPWRLGDARIRYVSKINKTDIRRIEEADVTPDFAMKLQDLQINPQKSMELDAYRRVVRLFDEFIKRCSDYPEASEIASVRDGFRAEQARVEDGEVKAGGEWLTPVAAAVSRFNHLTDEMAATKKTRGYNGDEGLQEKYQGLWSERNEVTRKLPELVRERVLKLVADKRFDIALEEIVGFRYFWYRQVAKLEETRRQEIEEVLSGMDFTFIRNLERSVVQASTKSKSSSGKPSVLKKTPEMVYVPGGYFMMGNDEADPTGDSYPIHLVYVSPFLIDKWETSNEEYREFLEEIKDNPAPGIEHSMAPPLKKHDPAGWEFPSISRDRQPVVGVDWFDAYAYAKWVGKRLPTEAEWELAARGMDERKYPWGDDIEGCSVNWLSGQSMLAKEMDEQNPPLPPEPEPRFGCSCVEPEELPPPPPTKLPRTTWDVDKHLPPEVLEAIENELFEWDKEYFSPYGAMHMAGNAAEWVLDWYDQSYYWSMPGTDPQGPEEKEWLRKSGSERWHVHRGGSYQSSKAEALATYRRGHFKRLSGAKWDRYMKKEIRLGRKPFVGFRCAKSLDIAVPR
ncbi:MAG: SUMF1/EgtB/PvdO family nonheme iron enzyme [Kiritimatiellia bacterium]|nr:SUMF1/EgtB/PvdO family nonheme iron enzyme [Kiritimatiellia bacterium]